MLWVCKEWSLLRGQVGCATEEDCEILAPSYLPPYFLAHEVSTKHALTTMNASPEVQSYVLHHCGLRSPKLWTKTNLSS